MHASVLAPTGASVTAPLGAGMFDKEITGFSIDSRSVQPGELFFALSPEDYARHCFTATSFGDAHEFIPQAFERGAIAVVGRAARVEGEAELGAFKNRLLLVEDVIDALQNVARGSVDKWGRTIVGITGSAGKTTTKDIAAHLLRATGRRVLSSKKNFNNELGVPLSVLQMETAGARPDDFDVAVIEMGMSMPNEIAKLCEVTPPDVGVVLMVSPVHLEFLGTIENIAAAKAQMIENIKPGGTAVLNNDDAHVAAMRAKHAGQTITFGIEKESDVMASNIEMVRLGLSRFQLRTPLGEADAELPMPGRHNLMNALAAAAVATTFDITPEQIAGALASCAPSEMRGEVINFTAGFTVIDDSYNSNPRSLIGMVRALAEGRDTRTNRCIVVAGEMLEIGAESEAMHREVGREIAGMKIDLLWGVRGHGRELVEGAREAGMPAGAAKFFETSDEAATALAGEARAGDLVLVKGSRGVRTDTVVKLLRERYEIRDEGGGMRDE